jgi:glycosyltransferase involved in cell wall biosynthesis
LARGSTDANILQASCRFDPKGSARLVTDNPKISVVIPVYNEMATIEEILLRVQSVDLDKEIVIVDDGSKDGTRNFLQALAESAKAIPSQMNLPRTGKVLETGRIRVFFQDKNQGKGAALRRGFEESKGEIVIIQDADLEYDPSDYHRLVAPIVSGHADVVYGSRFLSGPHRVHLFWHYVGNKFLTLLSNMVTNINLSDVWTCYKALRREVLQSIVPVLPHVTIARTKGYEIIERVVAQLAPFDLVVNLQVLKRPALLASPLIPLEHPLHQPPVNLLPQFDPLDLLQHFPACLQFPSRGNKRSR